ncbi:MAG: hypothetical protein GEU80_09005 [Dehalococcoidia bacterium]|nr:hypothetical protein [Dehalococcoidia bacterium]
MKRWLLALLAGAVLVSTAVASAAALEVRGGTMQVFTFDFDFEVPAPGPVTDLGCTFAQGTGTLAWGAVPGAEGYRVYRSPSGKEYTEHSVVTEPLQTISTQLGHFYAVAAFNATGESALSAPVHCPTSDKSAGSAGPGETSDDPGTPSLLTDEAEGGDPTPPPTPEEAGGEADDDSEGDSGIDSGSGHE